MVTIYPDTVQDLMDATATRELMIVMREFERPPYYHPERRPADTRLHRAGEVIDDGRVTWGPNDTVHVRGSKGRLYVCTDVCTCDASQKSQSKYCYHLVAAYVFREWQRRLQPSLALPPTTADERLAALTPHDPLDAPESHEEPPMAADEYIPEPEPDAAPRTPVEPSRGTRPLVPLAPTAHSLEQAMAEWSAQRAVMKRFIQQELTASVDYYQLQLKGRTTKPVLSKAGSEKVIGLLHLAATFTQDEATWTMLGRPEGTLVYICRLHTRSGELVGEGRGARSVRQDNGDLNKAIKMAQKSAQIDAVLRSGALSDVFTQEVSEEEDVTTPAPAKPPTPQDLRARIWAIVQERAPHLTDRAEIAAWIRAETGWVLDPETYAQVLERLEESRP